MKILIVEDDRVTMQLLERNFEKWGYDVASAADGRIAWQCIVSEPFDVIVSDWLMPELNGLELCQRVRQTDFDHYIYMILVSSQDTRMDVVKGLEAGVDDFVTKPVNLEELHARLEIGRRIVKLERTLRQKLSDIEKNHYQTVRMFTQLLEVYDENLGGHCRRVGQLSLEMARQHPDIDEKTCAIVEAAGLLHDIGMIGLPTDLLTKRRTEMQGDENALFRSHPERGGLILNGSDLLKPVAEIVRMHHEQFNGRGFPEGMAGHQIPIPARIVSAASMYDNLIHRGNVPMENATEHLQRFSGYQLDPDLVDMLLEINLDRIQQESLRKDQVVAVEHLKPGMTLARHVRMKTGAFVMAADTDLDAHGIEKLNHFVRLGTIGDKVFVYKSEKG